jgi:hypothetical protein
MRTAKIFVALVVLAATAGMVLAIKDARAATRSLAVGPQYNTTHVYVAPEDFDRFVESLIATFGGTKPQGAVINITPTPSEVAGGVHPSRYILGVRFQDSDSLSVWQ